MTTYRFPLDGAIDLHVRIGQGSVTVDTADDLDAAIVELTSRAGNASAADQVAQISVAMRGRTLDIAGTRQGGVFDLASITGRRSTNGVDVHVLVPTSTPVKISTFTAPISIAGRVGAADLTFGRSRARIHHVDGDLRLRYGDGDAEADHVGGSVQLRSGTGDARFGEIGGDLRAGRGNGDLRVGIVRGSVSSRCGAGPARLGEVHGDVDVASGSGAVEIGLSVGQSARLDLTSGSGQVRSELPVSDAPTSATEAITVRARTGNGEVRVFRSVA